MTIYIITKGQGSSPILAQPVVFQMDFKEEIKAETLKGIPKVQPVGSVTIVRTIHSDQQRNENHDAGNQRFSEVLAKQQQVLQIAKATEKDKTEGKFEGKINYYNHYARELSFGMTIATTDMKC